MGILKSIFGSSVEKSFVGDAKRVVSVCQSYGPLERGDLKACVTMALAFCILDSEAEKDQSIHLALESMEAGRRLSDNEVGLLSKYNLRLMSLQRQAHQSKSPINNRIASGIPVWIVSIRALMYVSVLPHAREVWTILQDGDALRAYDEIDRAMRQLGAHPLGAALERVGSLMTPSLFEAR